MKYLVHLLLTSCIATTCSTACGDLAATIRQTTGEFRLTNVGTESFNLVGYTVDFPTEDLLADQWLPVSGRLDSSIGGDGSFDSEGPWVILAPDLPVPMESGELSEGTVTPNGGTLGVGERLYLGNVWDIGTAMDVQVTVVSDTDVIAPVTVSYVPAGDYNEDGIVDNLDYILWKDEFGMSGSGLLSDGNADQNVDIADYTLWRNNLGATAVVIAPAISATSVTVIPEPSAVVLVSLGIISAAFVKRNYWLR